ncbi:undecaprenyldiphospho-muramoylpentapeptide beta-N-acetylglucosaminyltransferase [Pendulispora albinea]|uniref:UDP-N-acetylglucosamine--N-acetylmuramyl-(pentapeptide) pyrophosphoryl-undecaprenol N-acetylglucosamine transferase n=1 Tax=Pendulispora albinea TaxID=2741071 RepID=A0ABZ2M0Y3_9BACT
MPSESSNAPKPRIVIAGGGTGGHVFPGFAIAAAASELADVEVTFVGTARGLEARTPIPAGHRLELLDVQPIKGGGVTRALRGTGVAARATVRALALLRRLSPRVVLSVGGYASGPVALAAAMRGVPLAIFEPNAAMGLANKVVAPFAQRAYLALVESEGGLLKIPTTVRSSSVRILGVPLRKAFRPSPYRPSPSFRVLVLGGSQGAAAFNERMPEAIARLLQTTQALQGKLEVLHQSGRDRETVVRNAYERERVSCATVTEFIEDTAEAIARADVVVGRAGAGAVAEIAAVGRAAILVPFPFAADDHQAKNAAVFVRAGGGITIRQEAADSVRLAAELARLFTDEEGRVAMADAARSFGRPDAAHNVAEDLLRLARFHVEAHTKRVDVVTNGAGHGPGTNGHYRRIPETS